ncbi:MAG TPA: HesA/MoeB/ThiF family protein [Spirochaetia bacterium]|nr:HesA/MoeB/ThiF family protein [Spirochaetia bacterium]
MLDAREKTRYFRQIAIEEFGETAQEKLKAARVLVAGAGGLGCTVSLLLAAAGVGSLRLADHGRVELGNLNRQLLYTVGDEGRLKVEAASRRLSALNPGISVETTSETIGPGNCADLLEGCSLAVDALDNLPTRYALNAAAVGSGIPLVHGAINGFDGQAMTVIPRRSACLMCLFQGAERTGIIPVFGSAPALIGAVEATEAVKVLTGIGTLLTGRLLLYDGRAMSFSEIEVHRDPQCPHCGDL